MGCGQGGSRTEQPIDAVIDPQPDRSQPITPKLNGSHQVYDKSGAREVYAALENPGFADIEAMLENAFADASAPRGRVLLARDVDSGDIIAVTRTPDGQLELSVNMKVGGNRFEANQFNVNSLATVISIFKAFYDTDARIRTLIEWDEVVE